MQIFRHVTHLDCSDSDAIEFIIDIPSDSDTQHDAHESLRSSERYQINLAPIEISPEQTRVDRGVGKGKERDVEFTKKPSLSRNFSLSPFSEKSHMVANKRQKGRSNDDVILQEKKEGVRAAQLRVNGEEFGEPNGESAECVIFQLVITESKACCFIEELYCLSFGVPVDTLPDFKVWENLQILENKRLTCRCEQGSDGKVKAIVCVVSVSLFLSTIPRKYKRLSDFFDGGERRNEREGKEEEEEERRSCFQSRERVHFEGKVNFRKNFTPTSFSCQNEEEEE